MSDRTFDEYFECEGLVYKILNISIWNTIRRSRKWKIGKSLFRNGKCYNGYSPFNQTNS